MGLLYSFELGWVFLRIDIYIKGSLVAGCGLLKTFRTQGSPKMLAPRSKTQSRRKRHANLNRSSKTKTRRNDRKTYKKEADIG